MSTIAVNAITDANGGNTTSINNTTPNAYNTVGKNLIINGAMQIAQRGTSSTGITSSGYYTCDRWQTVMNSLGTWTVEQSTDAPDGFSNSLKHSCTTADASPASNKYAILYYQMEGLSLQQLAKGTTSAKPVTLSFWVKSNKTGDLQVNFSDANNTRIIGNTITINSSATWEKKTLTFAGDTTGTINNNNSLGASLEFWLDSGTDYSGGTVPTSWEATVDTDRNAGGTLALADSTSNYINITGVQLEVGESATEFEHRPYTTELSLCHRYYQKVGNGVVGDALWSSYGATYNHVNWKFTVTMRATPTIGGIYIGSLYVGGPESVSAYNTGSNYAAFGWNNSGGGTYGTATADAEL
jgi:hypothetical protein